jgi:hypothetical protein
MEIKMLLNMNVRKVIRPICCSKRIFSLFFFIAKALIGQIIGIPEILALLYRYENEF